MRNTPTAATANKSKFQSEQNGTENGPINIKVIFVGEDPAKKLI